MRTGEVSAHSRAWRFERHVVEAWIDHAANRAFSTISSMLDFNRNTHFCSTLLDELRVPCSRVVNVLINEVSFPEYAMSLARLLTTRHPPQVDFSAYEGDSGWPELKPLDYHLVATAGSANPYRRRKFSIAR
jgi:hypothetical protein